MTQIAVVDYGIGNIQSMCRALEKSGADIVLTGDFNTILKSDGVVLPGVGAFSHGMEKLRSLGLADILKEFAKLEKPMLGVCLGMQLFFDKSSEFGETDGLGIVPGSVDKIELKDDKHEKLPHVSWNELSGNQPWGGTILDGIEQSSDMYFVHSYCVSPSNSEDILSTTTYSGNEFCSTIKHKNIYGCQYHPEKSGELGLKIIKNFVNLCRG